MSLKGSWHRIPTKPLTPLPDDTRKQRHGYIRCLNVIADQHRLLVRYFLGGLREPEIACSHRHWWSAHPPRRGAPSGYHLCPRGFHSAVSTMTVTTCGAHRSRCGATWLPQVGLLGHIISAKGKSPDPEKDSSHLQATPTDHHQGGTILFSARGRLL